MSYSESDWLKATKTHTFYISRCFYLPHSDNIQHDSLCPWILLEWFHQTPGKKQKNPNKPLKVISLENAPLSPSVQLLSLTKASKDR